jgi:hypothetical protein
MEYTLHRPACYGAESVEMCPDAVTPLVGMPSGAHSGRASGVASPARFEQPHSLFIQLFGFVVLNGNYADGHNVHQPEINAHSDVDSPHLHGPVENLSRCATQAQVSQMI